jgi:outer membrane protein assembly factor BamB
MQSSFRISLFILPLLTATLSAAEPSTDWPVFGGPNGNNCATDKGLNKDWDAKPPKELWRIKLLGPGDAMTTASISVAGGSFFMIDHDAAQGQSMVRAFALADGKERWRFAFEDAEKENHGFDRAMPVFEDGKVYCLGRQGLLLCLDAKTGAKLWSVDLVKDFAGRKPFYGYSAAPVIEGDALLILHAALDDLMMKLDKRTGKRLPWRATGCESFSAYSPPLPATIRGVQQYVVMTYSSVCGIEKATGKTLWQFPSEGPIGNATQPLVVGDSVFVPCQMRSVVMLDITADGAVVRYHNKKMANGTITPLLKDGYIYFIGGERGDGAICVDLKTGKQMWKSPKVGFGSSTVGLDGAFIVRDGVNGNATLVKMSPDSYKVLGRVNAFTTEGSRWTPPMIANGKMLLQNTDEIVCFDLK